MDTVPNRAGNDPGVAGLQRAAALGELGRYGEAVIVVNRVLAQDPDNHFAHCLAASFSIRLENYQQAKAAAERAIALEPEDDWPHRLRSLALSELGFHKKALDSAREAVRLSPESPESHVTLCEAAIGHRRVEEAREAAQRVVSMIPDEVDGYQCLGLIALNQRQFKDAEQHFRKALEIDPANYEAINNLGVALARQRGRREDSMDTFHQAVQVNPSQSLARQNLHASARRYVYGGLVISLFVISRFAWLAVESTTIRSIMLAAIALVLITGAAVAWSRSKELSPGTKMMMSAHFRSGPTPWFLGMGVAGIIIAIIVSLN